MPLRRSRATLASACTPQPSRAEGYYTLSVTEIRHRHLYQFISIYINLYECKSIEINWDQSRLIQISRMWKLVCVCVFIIWFNSILQKLGAFLMELPRPVQIAKWCVFVCVSLSEWFWFGPVLSLSQFGSGQAQLGFWFGGSARNLSDIQSVTPTWIDTLYHQSKSDLHGSV